MEYFDIVDENGIPNGETIERSLAHSIGVAHRTAHVWILRWKAGKLQILLQKRCMEKDSFPGCYDISSAGHVPAGSQVIESALRELKEELGVDASPEDLKECGLFRLKIDEVFHGKRFKDNQISWVYALWIDSDEDGFVVQSEEIDEVKWFDFKECKELVETNGIKHCISLDELKMLEENI